MNKTNDGGPAFPTITQETVGERSGRKVDVVFNDKPGMTLRDWFAGKAMQAYLTGDRYAAGANDEVIASWSYKTADAMLKAREETR